MERPLLSDSLAKATFDDAAVYFSEEQWQNLEDFQKKIYKELIQEIYETMLALGYRIPKPEIVCRIERGEEPCIDTCKKAKPQGSPPEGSAAASKDSDTVIKVERESPEASIPFHPNEISSSQERNGSQCPRCGTCCNNQCSAGYGWHTQGMYAMSPMDRNQGKPYVTSPPSYYNGNPVSPGFASRGDGVSHTTSPRSAYGNVGMVPLSPQYAGYRNTGEPISQFPGADRAGNPMFVNFDVNPQTQMGPPGGYVDHQSRCRKDQFPHSQEASFQDRRNAVTPCPHCGAFCNNQCAMSFQWEQRRLHHPNPGVIEGGSRYVSPPNPYFSGVANSSFPNVRPPVRHGASPVNVQGNTAMIQLSPQYSAYRRASDPKSPNVLPGKLEHPGGNAVNGGNAAAAASPHGPNQSNYGSVSANSGGYQRKTQSMSPLVAIETMPMFGANANQSNSIELKNRPSAQTVTSSDGNKDRSAAPRNNNNPNRRPDHAQFSIQGGRINRVLQSSSPATGSSGQQKPIEVTSHRNSSPSVSAGPTCRNSQPSSSTVLGHEAGRSAAGGESYGVKRSAQQAFSDSSHPPKRASPPVIIVDSPPGGKRNSTPSGPVSVSPSTSKSGSLSSTPAMAHGNQDVRKSSPHEPREGRRPTPPITISNIRSAGIFIPPSKARRDGKRSTSPIIIIDDKDVEPVAPHTSNNETKGSSPGTSSVTNSRNAAEPQSSSKISPQGAHQGPPAVVSKVQVQQPSPIIVTGGSGLGNQPVPVSGNSSIMWTFPVTVGSSGIMLATPLNIAEKPVQGVKTTNRVPISKNPRVVPPNAVTLNATSGNMNAKFAPVTVTSVLSQPNSLPVSLPPAQAKPIAVNMNHSSNISGSLIKNPPVQKVNGGAIKAVAPGANQPITQTLFVDANSGLILTGSPVPPKDTVTSGIGNATVVTVNGNVVAGNVAPVALGGKLAFRNIAPVNYNKVGNTTFFTVDSSPVALANNGPNFNNKGTLSINNPTILTLNGGLPIANTGTVAAPIANIASVNANATLQVAPASAPAQQSNGMIIRRVGEPNVVSQQPGKDQAPLVVERLFNCSECGEKFNSLENLSSHQSVHKQPAPDSKSTEPQNGGPCESLPGATDDDAPTILYTTQGDDGSTVYVVTV